MRLEARRRMQAWMRPRQPEALPVQLDRHRIYVLPTASGLFFSLLLGTMLLGALNFNNNPALLLALLLAGAALASLIAAHLQLSGLRVEAVSAEPCSAGEAMQLRIALTATDARVRRGLRLAVGDASTHTRVDAQGCTVLLHIPTQRRGLLPLSRIELRSVQPLGLARAWGYVWPAQNVLVYPAAETQAPPLPIAEGGNSHPKLARTGEDPHHLRSYRQGDPPRAVAWKASARRDTLLVREYELPRGGELTLDWQQHTQGLPYEQRIRRLARWVDDAEREGRRYALQLPASANIGFGTGAQHRHLCLRALALMPDEARHG